MPRRKNIALLGSTGSIGRSTLDVLSHLQNHFRVTYLSAHRNIDLLREQITRFRPKGVVVLDERNAVVLRTLLTGNTQLLVGEEGLLEAVGRDDTDLVLNAMVGFAGLRPTIRAIETGKDVALANKESLVVAGEIIMQKIREHKVRLLPVDSEHSAILQCLQGENLSSVTRLIITASGGPFLHVEKERFDSVTVAEALNHPTWKMGDKITIDSATLMNKGLEVIEAHWLFGLPSNRIEVLIHPQSLIHSMVEFADGSVKAQLGMPDMRLPIQYALMQPERPAAPYRRMDFAALRAMTFQAPDLDKFRCLPLCFQALQIGGTAPAVLNAANEVAVQMFLSGEIPFSSIPVVIAHALSSHQPLPAHTLDDLIRIDRETRELVRMHFGSGTQMWNDSLARATT